MSARKALTETKRPITVEDHMELSRIHAAKKTTAVSDALKFPGGDQFEADLTEIFSSDAESSGEIIAIALIDCDRFDHINKDFGISEGDRILQDLKKIAPYTGLDGCRMRNGFHFDANGLHVTYHKTLPYSTIVESDENGVTRTAVLHLDRMARAQELARMVGGAGCESESSIRHAMTMLDEAEARKQALRAAYRN